MKADKVRLLWSSVNDSNRVPSALDRRKGKPCTCCLHKGDSVIVDLVDTLLAESVATLQAVRDDASVKAAVLRAAGLIAAGMQAGNKLMTAGNGGSAADAQHVAAEFVCRLTVNRPALPAIALTTDSSILTAMGNDRSYDEIFERQIEALGRAGDVFLAISTSGESRNILKALRKCRQMGILTLGLSGNKGGSMAELCDVNVIVPSNVTMHIQEAHLALEHVLCTLVERLYFGTDFAQFPRGPAA